VRKIIVCSCVVVLLSACTSTNTHPLASMCSHTKHQEICNKVNLESQVDLIVNLSAELTDRDKRNQLISVIEGLGFEITSQLETLPVMGVVAFSDNWYLLSEIDGVESFSLSGTVDAFPDEGNESLQPF